MANLLLVQGILDPGLHWIIVLKLSRLVQVTVPILRGYYTLVVGRVPFPTFFWPFLGARTIHFHVVSLRGLPSWSPFVVSTWFYQLLWLHLALPTLWSLLPVSRGLHLGSTSPVVHLILPASVISTLTAPMTV